MKLRDFLRDYLLRRLEEACALVVYDPQGWLRETALSLHAGEVRVVDAQQPGAIQAREAAMEAWLELRASSSGGGRLLIYVRAPKPKTDEERWRDPYWSYASCAKFFPYKDSEEFVSLARQAKPGFEDEVTRLWQNGARDFAQFDALDGGARYPMLETHFGAVSEREIWRALLCDTSTGKAGAWLEEWKPFALASAGLKVGKATTTPTLREGAWEWVLFSDFCFGLNGELPLALAAKERAPEGARELMTQLARELRDSHESAPLYRAQAERVTRRLELAERCEGAQTDQPAVATFAWQEAAFLRLATQSAKSHDLARARANLESRRDAFWLRGDAKLKAQWQLALCALQVLETERELRGIRIEQAPSAWVEFYARDGFRLDRAYRDFESAADALYGAFGESESLALEARGVSRAMGELWQKNFMVAIERGGWPASESARATQVFDRFVKPALVERRRVAYFLLDALRFEVGAQLAESLRADGEVTLHAVCASAPSITPWGMASLMPEADGKLALGRDGAKLSPRLREQWVRTPQERLKSVQQIYGDRANMVELRQLHSAQAPAQCAGVDLLLVRSTDLDATGERDARDLRGKIPGILAELRVVLGRLGSWGFQEAVIATDHGFLLFDSQNAGDVVTPPAGNWLDEGARYRLGMASGHGQTPSLCLPLRDAGVRVEDELASEIEVLAIPATLGTFERHSPYVHGGLSLPEAVIPVLQVPLRAPSQGDDALVSTATLGYKGGQKKITMQRPSLDLALTGLMEGEVELRIRVQSLEAQSLDADVGHVAGDKLDSATGTLRLLIGSTTRLPLVMDEAFEGRFRVSALDARTGVLLGKLELETNYAL